MASGDLSNQVPILPGGGFLKDSIIGGMPGPLPDTQQRHWIPDERDNFINWLRGEFAAANAIIDTLCHHLQLIGKPGEYDFVLTCIQQRRYNWTVVLHMQQYFSVAEVVFALQQVVWLKQALNSDPSGLPPLFVSHAENGGGPPWKEGPMLYRDPRGESHISGALHHNSVPEELHHGRKEASEGSRKSEEHGERRRSESGDQARQQQPIVFPSNPDPSPYPNRNQADQAEQSTAGVGTSISDSSSSDTSSVSIVPAPTQGILEAKEAKVADQRSHEQGDLEGNSSIKLEGSEGPSSEKGSTPYFQISSKEEEDRRLASIKIAKSYSCMEQIEGKMVNTVDGLEMHGKVLDKPESNRMASLIQEIRTSGKTGGSTAAGSKKGAKGKGRELLQFGHSHHHFLEDHKRRSFPKDDFVPPIPAFLEAIIDRLIRWHIIPASKRPDCCSINFMEEGDYLPPHLDNSHLERPYCTLALQSECTLILGHSLTTSTPGDFKGPFEISLPVGSVLILQRNSADIAKHGIPAVPCKRIFITLGKVLSTRPSRGHNNNTQTITGIAQSPPRPTSTPSSNSWGPSFNHNTNNRQGNNNSSNVQHNNSARSGGSGGGFGTSFKSHKYTPVSSSSQSSAGGVLPNPTARPPQSAHQLISNAANSVPPIFTGTPGPPSGGAFPPSMPIPTWSPLPRPPSRPPSAGTGVFFPSGGASSGPGRPVNAAPSRRSSGNSIPSGPPLLQKTNSAPASFASLEAAAIAATAAAACPSTPPGKSSKPTSATTSGSIEKVVPAAADSADRGLLPTAAAPQDANLPLEKAPSSDPLSDVNGTKNTVKQDNPAVVRSSGRSSKSSGPGNSSRTNTVSSGGGHS